MSKARRRTVKGLIVLGSVLAFLSVFAIWIERQALNTDDWVSTSSRLIENQEIRTALSKYLVDQLYENVNVEKELEDILPGESKKLAGPVAGGLRTVGNTGAEKVLESGTAQGFWEDANRTAHEQLIAVLENKKEAVETANGEVTLNLGSMLTNFAKQVGIGQNLAEKLPSDAGQIKILKSEQLKTAQNIAVAIKGSALILSLLTFFVFGLAMYLTKGGRFVTVLFSGIGLIAAGLAVIVARHIAGGIIVDQLVTAQSAKPAAEAAWGIATSLMVSIASTVIVIGALFVVAGWLASPTRAAREARRVFAPALSEYAPWVYTGLAVVFGIYLLSAPGVGLRSFLTTLVVAGMAAFGVHERRGVPRRDLCRHLRLDPRPGGQRLPRLRDRRAGQRADLETAAAGSADAGAWRRGGRAPPRARAAPRRAQERRNADGGDGRGGRPHRPPRTARRAAREGHPHRGGVRGREGARARARPDLSRRASRGPSRSRPRPRPPCRRGRCVSRCCGSGCSYRGAAPRR
jgi:hypothetical protein